VASVYKLIITTDFSACTTFVSVICFIVNGFNVTGFKLGLYFRWHFYAEAYRSKTNVPPYVLYLYLDRNAKEKLR
jgi:hypothetical protein